MPSGDFSSRLADDQFPKRRGRNYVHGPKLNQIIQDFVGLATACRDQFPLGLVHDGVRSGVETGYIARLQEMSYPRDKCGGLQCSAKAGVILWCAGRFFIVNDIEAAVVFVQRQSADVIRENQPTAGVKLLADVPKFRVDCSVLFGNESFHCLRIISLSVAPTLLNLVNDGNQLARKTVIESVS